MALEYDDNRREKLQHMTDGICCAAYLDEYRGAEGYPWHWHDEMELACVIQGELELLVHSRTVCVRQGEGIFINAGVLHAYRHTQDGLCRMPNVLFHPAFLSGPEGSVFYPRYLAALERDPSLSYVIFTPDADWNSRVLCQLQNSYRLLSEKDYGYELRLRSALSEIILELNRHCLKQKQQENAGGPTETGRMRNMLDYIRQHYAEPLSVERIAASADVSKRECLRCFQKTIAMTPMQYVREWRVDEAKRLLRETSCTCLEIAERCGFQSQSYFGKIFRETVGKTPGDYRSGKTQPTGETVSGGNTRQNDRGTIAGTIA